MCLPLWSIFTAAVSFLSKHTVNSCLCEKRPGFKRECLLVLADIQCLFCRLLGIITKLNHFSSPVTMSWEFTPASSVKYINHFLSRCHSLSLLFLTQLVWCPPGTDLFSYGDGHEVLYGHFHRIMERRVETFWMLIWGSSSMSWWTWLILALVMDVTLWPVWSLCLSDSSPHSNWATHLWTVRCEGIHSTPPLTKYWCICIAANPWYVFLILTCAAICKISMPSDNNYWSTVIPHMILNAIWNGKKRGNILIIYVYLDSQIKTYM